LGVNLLVKKIVLVVDSAIIALEISRTLKNKGYLVSLITNTLKKVLKEAYDLDLVIIDIDFIPTDQIDEVKAPIMFLTSQHESDININEISSLQVTYDFLYKPFTEEELLHKTRQILLANPKNS
jgi:DNA-binding response OmpR family regulator